MKISKEKTYTIFTFVCGNEVLIGKTTSRRISAVYHRHCRGEVFATRHWAELGVKPRLHVLFRDEMEAYEAYRQIVAYVHYFNMAGFDVLNSSRTIEKAGSLHSETQCLVDEIQKEPVEELLARTLVVKPGAADMHHSAEENISLTPADQKLTIRLSEWEKKRFDRIAETMHMSQRETIQYLISKLSMPNEIFPPWEEDAYIRAILGALRDENKKLHEENEQFKAAINTERKVFMKDKKKQFDALRVGISSYFKMMESAHPVPLAVERMHYKNFADVGEYQYPDSPGMCFCRPTVILTGKGRYPALFILGVADNSELLKFRYYPKTYFVGVDPSEQSFALRGSVWLFGFEEASDGAMDLVFAFPCDIRRSYQRTQADDSSVSQALAEILGRDESESNL